MEPITSNISAIGNHGQGSQNLHTGQGNQHTILGGTQFNIQGPFIVDRGLEQFTSSDNKDRWNALSDKSHVSSINDIFSWLDSICDTSHIKRHDLAIAKRTPRTGQWLLRSTKFQGWKDEKGLCLWLDGIIGAGKSTLASIVVDHLKGIAGSEERICCVCIYFYDGDEITLNSVYANLIYQVLEQSKKGRSIDELKKRYEPSMLQAKKVPPNAEDLLRLLKIESERFDHMFLIVDALDSCRSTSDFEIQQKLVREIRRSLLSNKWSVLITTRSDVSNECKEPSDLEMNIEAQRNDIKLYIEKRIEESFAMSRFIQNGNEANLSLENICEAVLRNSRGMFLLATLHMDRLEHASQKTPGHFSRALRHLPTDLTKTFDAAIKRITKQTPFYINIATQALSWLLFSERPVTIDEVKCAIELDEVELQEARSNDDFSLAVDRITSSCGGIVSIDQTHKILRPIHESALDHIRKSSIIPLDPHTAIAQQCLKYLLLRDFEEYLSPKVDVQGCVRRYPLARYAAQHWFRHVHQARRSESLDELVIKFLKRKDAVSMSFLINNPIFSKDITGLHASVFFGMNDWARRLIDDGFGIDSTDDDDRTALHWAARYNRTESLELLLNAKADINSLDKGGNTPLHLAVASAHEDSTRSLINHGAKPDVWNRQNWTPLRSAIKLGHLNVAAILVQNRVEVDIEDKDGWTPLRWVVFNETLDLVKIMLANGYDINRISSQDEWNLLHHAIEHQYEELVTLLLTHKELDIELRRRDGYLTPLMVAIKERQDKIVKLLLDHGADANAKCEDGQTPMILAAKSGNHSAAWLLLENDARIDEQDVNGSSALHHAVECSSTSIAWLLIEKGANIDLRNKKGETVLYNVVKSGNVSLIWLLVEKGADMNIMNYEGITPCHLAAQLENDKIVSFLTLNKPDIAHQKDKDGMTALHHAAKRGHTKSAVALIQNGADIDAVDNEGSTGLHYATGGKHDETVDALLSEKPSLDIQDKNGLTALHHAVLYGNLPTVCKLSEEWAILDIRDNDGRTALICAAQTGHKLATLRLLDQGADVEVQDKDGRTAHDHAAIGNHTVAANLLKSAKS